MREIKTIYVAIAVIMIFILIGFFLLFSSIGTLRGDLENLKLAIHFKEQNGEKNAASSSTNTTIITTSTSPTDIRKIEVIPKEDVGTEISTAIVFEASSTAALLPQTTVTVIVESVIQYTDGTIAVNIRAFTNKATSYTAFDPKSVIQILNLDGNNQIASDITGKFDSIPPKSASSGTLVFDGLSGRNTIILQIGTGETIKFYKFDFLKKTYEETIVG